MSGGDVQFLVGTLITQQVVEVNQVLDLPEFNTIECCFKLTVLADTNGTDNNKNDKSSAFFQKGIAVVSSALFLEKEINGSWAEVATLDDNTLGTLHDYGFWAVPDQFSSIGFIIDWTLLMQSVDPNLGEGLYRIRCDHTTLTATIVSEYDCERNLLLYTPERAEETIRFEYYLNGLHGNDYDRTTQVNYGDKISGNEQGWFNQIRIGGFFGFETRDQEETFRQFKNKSKQQLTNTQTPKFTAFIDVKYLNMDAHYKLMKMYQSSFAYVTDYNQGYNPEVFIDFAIILKGGYEPEYFRGNKNSKVILEGIEQKFNTYQWKPC